MDTGMSLSNLVSVEIGTIMGTERNGSIDLFISLFSNAFKWASVSFQYKRDLSDEWRQDAVILSGNSKTIAGNLMYGLPCSPNGTKSRITWHHSANGVATGSKCHIKAVVVPSAVAIGDSWNFSYIETVFGNGDREIGRAVAGNAVGFDFYGNVIVVGDSNVLTIDQVSGETVIETPDMTSPKHAVGSPRGGVIVIQSDGEVLEFDTDGVLIDQQSASAIASGDASLSLHPPTGNLLIAGGDTHMVGEMAWGGPESGTVLWTHGSSTPGLGDDALYLPRGACYGVGVENIVICDTGNNRVVLIDRSHSPEIVSSIDSVTVGEEEVTIRQPVRCAMSENGIFVFEADGARVDFGSTYATHPALSRSRASTGINSLPQYAGLLFVPLIRSIR